MQSGWMKVSLGLLFCIVILFLFGGVFLPPANKAPMDDAPSVYVEVGRGTISFTVFDRWNCRKTTFRDQGFDGTLDFVSVTADGVRVIAKMQSARDSTGKLISWSLWEQRYLETRVEAGAHLQE